VKNSIINNRISSVAVLLPVLVSLFVTTGINIDPVNVPKMLLLVVGAGYLAGLLISLKIKEFAQNRIVSSATGLFLFGILISSIFSKSPILQTIYGSYGRNTGAITYIALCILLLGTFLVSNLNYVERFIIGLFFAGIFNVFYGMLQISGHDPVDWNNSFKAVIGTFGNPNFSSAFIALSLLTYPYVFITLGSLKYKYALFPTFLLSCFAILKTNSQQGYLLIAIGTSILTVTFLLKKIQKKVIGFSALGAVIIGGILGILGFLQIGPLGKILYQFSISLRGFYWRAGISMFQSSPLFGNGLDSYGDLYLRNRSAASILPPGGEKVYSNAAHNVFIDIAASGGILMLIPYLVLIGYAILLVSRVLKSNEFNLTFTTLVSVWAAFLVQSTISINQIGLAVWIWATTGILIAHSLILLGTRKEESDLNAKKKVKNQQTSAGSFITSFILALIFGALALPEQVADMKFKSSMASHDIRKVQQAVNAFPLSSERLSRSSQVFLQNSLFPEALEISIKAVKFNPDSLNSWITLLTNPKATPSQRKLAQENLIRLDPRSSEWRKFVIK